jgi:hypothetical protein
MFNNYLIKISLFLIIFLILFLINKYAFQQKKENFGVYCGSYNLESSSSSAQSDCVGNSECQWNPYTSKSGTVGGWCGNHS